MSQATLRESAFLTPDPASGRGIWRACLIAADVQGSSGFYPADVLRRDGAGAFPAGTHIYFDHPTRSDEEERPERSVKEMAGVLLDDAAFEDSVDGRGLFARVQFFEDVKDMVGFRAGHIGLSIRAAGQITETPQGQRVVQSISHGLSVDLVTRAGAGGRLVTMTESAVPESPPAVQPATAPVAIPSTTGTGALLSEVASMKETFSDKIEDFSINVARLTQQIKESQRETANLARENKAMSDTLTFLRDRAETAERVMKESRKLSDVLTELLEAKLPMASTIRLAQSWQPGQDFPAQINSEREFLKKIMRESERGALNTREASGLGLTESVGAYTSPEGDLAEIRDLLKGGAY